MSTPPLASPLPARDLDRHLINRAGLIVDADALTDIPRTHLCGTAPLPLAAGVGRRAADPAPLLRLLMRAGSSGVPCALVAERLSTHLIETLATMRIPNVWNHAICAGEHHESGTNAYRAAAHALALPVERCLIVTAGPASADARTSGALRILPSHAGTLPPPDQSPSGLTSREHDVVMLLALGHSIASASELMDCSVPAASGVMARLVARHGRGNRLRTVAHLVTEGLVNTAVLRGSLPARLPDLTTDHLRVLTLLAVHETSAVAWHAGISQSTIHQVTAQAVAAVGARTRTHAVVTVLLLTPPDDGQSGSRPDAEAAEPACTA